MCMMKHIAYSQDRPEGATGMITFYVHMEIFQRGKFRVKEELHINKIYKKIKTVCSTVVYLKLYQIIFIDLLTLNAKMHFAYAIILLCLIFGSW